MRALPIAVLLAAGLTGAALAADPPDMAGVAKASAQAAPGALSRYGLGRTALPNFDVTKFRNVRAHYRRSDFFKDYVVFCGELDTKAPDGKMTGWIKFGYMPGDPTTLFTERDDVGMPQIGAQVLKAHCQSGQEQWLEADYTADFNRPAPSNVADAG
jgi:hypothetical protein